ncbi:hypothetical protein IBTHAUMO2_890003 [Nitrosopumilaceae archaeon]|nr:hypothetical protein IBTHAUMO2_890003 [Nitrosopumilaceae archaeon]
MACMTARATAPPGDQDGPGGDPGDPWPLDLIDECGPHAPHGS